MKKLILNIIAICCLIISSCGESMSDYNKRRDLELKNASLQEKVTLDSLTWVYMTKGDTIK